MCINDLDLCVSSGSPGVALYPVYCLINHACFNNTNYVKFPDLRLELRAQLPIRKGEEVFTRYISSTIGESDMSHEVHLSYPGGAGLAANLESCLLQAISGGARTSKSIGSSPARARAARTPPSWAPSCPPSAATRAGPDTCSPRTRSTPGLFSSSIEKIFEI